MELLSMNRWTFLAMGSLFAATAAAQMPQPLMTEDTVKISDHVWAIMGFPNIAIVVGDRATLVVDTGLGPRNGATVARAAAKLSKGPKLFLTTTHFHPEHAGGEAGFPAGTILIRNTVQQQEMEQHGLEIVDRFRTMSSQNAELLKDVHSRHSFRGRSEGGFGRRYGQAAVAGRRSHERR
jgi:glyoxylase-like metal-dependent hydrolase (beta-lactamase superfamily II)